MEENISTIDWKDIKDFSDILKLGNDRLYDYTYPNKEDEFTLTIRDGLNPDELKDAKLWQKILHGIIIITANPGNGKSLLQYVSGFKARRYFNLIPVIDHKPRELFGPYIPFSEGMFIEQLERMHEIAQFDNSLLSTNKPILNSSRGDVFLHNSIMILEDFQQYMPRNNHNLPIARTFGDLFTIWRHLQLTIFASATKIRDLNKHRCYPEVTCHIYCQRHPEHKINKRYKDIFLYWIKPIKWNDELKIFEKNGNEIKIFIDGGKPRPELGNNRYYDLYNSFNMTGIRAPKSLRKKYK